VTVPAVLGSITVGGASGIGSPLFIESIYSNLFLSRILYVDEDGVLAESLNSFEGDVLHGRQ